MTPIFGATIKVIAGFYLGCVGTLQSPYNAYVDQFDVRLTCQYKYPDGTNVNELISTHLDLKDIEITSKPR